MEKSINATVKSSKIIILFLIFVFLCSSCSTIQNNKNEPTGKIEIKLEQGIFERKDLPDVIKYERRWESYSEYYINKKEDMQNVVDALNNIKITEKSDVVVDDYTDILRLSYYGEEEIIIEFEEYQFVDSDGQRWKCSDLSDLRAFLNAAIEKEGTVAIDYSDHPVIPEEIKVKNFEDICYSEREIWEEFQARGFKEENITVMDFFGTQSDPEIKYSYNMDLEFNWDRDIDKESDEKHPDYHFLYITGDFSGYNYDTEELIAPSIYEGDCLQYWYIEIYGNSWYAHCLGNSFSGVEGDGYVFEGDEIYSINRDNQGVDNLIKISVKDSLGDVHYEKVDKITHESLSELARTVYKLNYQQGE